MELMIKKISAKMINRNDGTMIRVYFPPGESAFADKTPHAPQIKQHAQIEKHQMSIPREIEHRHRAN